MYPWSLSTCLGVRIFFKKKCLPSHILTFGWVVLLFLCNFVHMNSISSPNLIFSPVSSWWMQSLAAGKPGAKPPGPSVTPRGSIPAQAPPLGKRRGCCTTQRCFGGFLILKKVLTPPLLERPSRCSSSCVAWHVCPPREGPCTAGVFDDGRDAGASLETSWCFGKSHTGTFFHYFLKSGLEAAPRAWKEVEKKKGELVLSSVLVPLPS